jgi:hypothetical protein
MWELRRPLLLAFLLAFVGKSSNCGSFNRKDQGKEERKGAKGGSYYCCIRYNKNIEVAVNSNDSKKCFVFFTMYSCSIILPIIKSALESWGKFWLIDLLISIQYFDCIVQHNPSLSDSNFCIGDWVPLGFNFRSFNQPILFFGLAAIFINKLWPSVLCQVNRFIGAKKILFIASIDTSFQEYCCSPTVRNFSCFAFCSSTHLLMILNRVWRCV